MMKKEKKFLIISLVLLIFISAISTVIVSAESEKKQLRVIHFVNGNLGDKSFFDSAARGLSRARMEFGLDVRTIESGYDSSKWQPTLEQAISTGDYDILVAGTFEMVDLIQNISREHPDKKFMLYDDSVNYSKGSYSNVYSVLYKQNEGSYLIGLYAGLMTKSGVIGIIGGMNTPIINDFIVGYEQGARSARPDIKVIKRYAGSFDNASAGRELAEEIYGQNADIVFQAAGATGLGVFQAAFEKGKYAIGTDSDQAIIIEQANPEQAKLILTSMMKNVDNSLYRAIKLYLDGGLPFGQAEHLGIKENGVGLARNKYYNESTPADIKAKVDRAEKELLEGMIKVNSTIEKKI